MQTAYDAIHSTSGQTESKAKTTKTRSKKG